MDSNNEVTDITLYALGLMADEEVDDIPSAVMNGEEIETSGETRIAYEDILGTTFKMVLGCEYYIKNSPGAGRISGRARPRWI